MFEVVRRVVSHAELLHDGLRANVLRHRERNDFAEVVEGKAYSERFSRGFSGVAFAPMGTG
jgi:hypothetical protein